MRLAIGLFALTGCAQLLGLDSTKLDQKDAGVDAPSVCDGAPACTATSGRSVCGQLMQTGDGAGQPLRLAAPTGTSCAMLGSTEGPCALAIFGQPLNSYFSAQTGDRITGDIDDCGRFVVLDTDPSAASEAVVITGTGFEQSAAVVLNRPMTIGSDKNVILPAISTATMQGWGTQVSASNPPDVSGSYLVSYVSSMGAPLATEELRVNGAAVGGPPTTPWGAYFTGMAPLGTIAPGQTATQESGSALVVPPTGSFQLGGFRTGKNCTPVTLQAVPGALIHITLSC